VVPEHDKENMEEGGYAKKNKKQKKTRDNPNGRPLPIPRVSEKEPD
jgi:hypothetical protein